MKSEFKVMYEKTMYTFTRQEALATVWRHTHRDYRGTTGGVKEIMILRDNVTTVVSIDSLTDTEIECKLIASMRKEVERRAKKK